MAQSSTLDDDTLYHNALVEIRSLWGGEQGADAELRLDRLMRLVEAHQRAREPSNFLGAPVLADWDEVILARTY
jgi:hypothetical protein